MNKSRISPQKIILIFTGLLFGFFLLLPMVTILCKSFYEDGNATLEFYGNLFSNRSIFKAFGNSVLVSAASGIITTVLAFIPAYAVNFTNINKKLKKVISTLVMLPMLLPTITYGFAIIYSFGKQGLITKLLDRQLVDIYGIAGLIIGYVIYTFPISFMLINNTMGYIDKKFTIVSRMMGDGMGMLKWDHIHTMMKMPRITEEWKKAHGIMWDKADVDAIYEKSEKAIFGILDKFSTPKPFVLETIFELKKRGIKIGSTTGYTTEMMDIVTKSAAEQGYKPDAWFCPNHTENKGRPYPYMIFRNLEELAVSSVSAAIKVGDTVADIKEGKKAGMISIGIIEGSSVMGYTEAEYEAFSPERKELECQRVRQIYEACGADYVINNMSELIPLIEKIEE